MTCRNFFILFVIGILICGIHPAEAGLGLCDKAKSIAPLPISLSNKAEEVLKQSLAAQAPWAQTADMRDAWQTWANGAFIVPLRSEENNSLAAMLNPFANDAVFFKFDSGGNIKEYGYYSFGQAAFHNKQPLLDLALIHKNYISLHCRMLESLAANKEKDFFKIEPKNIKEADLVGFLYATEKEFDITVSTDFIINPFFQKLHHNELYAKDLAKYLKKKPEVAAAIQKKFKNKPIGWENIRPPWIRSDNGIINVVFFDTEEKNSLMLLFAFQRADGTIIKIDALLPEEN
ncbi:MAG: hypothetical protein AB7U41_05850 [Dongiaceae bacterium]